MELRVPSDIRDTSVNIVYLACLIAMITPFSLGNLKISST